MQEEGLVSLAPSPLWWLRSQGVELGLERQQQGRGRSWNVPERSGSDAREMLSHGAESVDLGKGFSAGVIKPAWTEDAASASCSTDVQL